MTKEVAITRVKHSSLYIHDRETADYIIKALEQQSSEDCVSRQQAIEFVNEAICGKNDFSAAIRDGLEAILSALPPVTPIIPKCITNGDMIMTMFPNEEIMETNSACVYLGVNMRFDIDWWNAPYNGVDK